MVWVHPLLRYTQPSLPQLSQRWPHHLSMIKTRAVVWQSCQQVMCKILHHRDQGRNLLWKSSADVVSCFLIYPEEIKTKSYLILLSHLLHELKATSFALVYLRKLCNVLYAVKRVIIMFLHLQFLNVFLLDPITHLVAHIVWCGVYL